MSDDAHGIRRATQNEIVAERAANPIDVWYQKFLDLDARTVARAARRLWGPPVSSGTGESMWKLWSDDLGVPAYIAVGLLPPAVLFSDGMCPQGDGDDRLRDQVRRMLLEADDRHGG